MNIDNDFAVEEHEILYRTISRVQAGGVYLC